MQSIQFINEKKKTVKPTRKQFRCKSLKMQFIKEKETGKDDNKAG